MGGTAQYNPVTGRIEIKPDSGGGWLKGFRQIDPAPANTVRACYFMRFWVEGIAPNDYISEYNSGWNLAAYLGFGWDEYSFSTDSLSEFDGFFGNANITSKEGGLIYLNARSSEAAKRDFASFNHLGNGAFSSSSYLTDGSGSYADFSTSWRSTSSNYPDDKYMPWSTFPIGQTKGQECTYYWEVRKDEGTNRIRMNARLNTGSLDLDALDFDANEPNTLIPASNSWEVSNLEIMSDAQYGASNPWIQTDGGDISWPTHLLVRWPFSGLGQNIILDKMITKYYQTL